MEFNVGCKITKETINSVMSSFYFIVVSLLLSCNSASAYLIDLNFTQPTYNVSIMENSGGKTYAVATSKMGMFLKSSSPDVKYSITEGDTNQLFKVESRRVGDFCFLRIRTRTNGHNVLNREQQDVYKLIIKATWAKSRNSQAGQTANTEVIVNVIDANDLSPLFDPTVYKVEINENTPLHQSIVKVSASDADIGVNGQIYYSFSQPTEMFAIHPTSGVITLIRTLSFADQSSYSIEVLARDRGPVSGRGGVRISRASVLLKVVEVNQHSPVINLQELPSIVEHGKIGTIYAVLYITDEDHGRNGQIDQVTIVGGDPNKNFAITKGQRDMEYKVQVLKLLDRETNPAGFNLTIIASDRGKPSRNTSKLIYVRLQDTNDNTPRFGSDFYHIFVDECLPVYTPVFSVVSCDADFGKNAERIYGLLPDEFSDLFEMNLSTGVLSIAKQLDAETMMPFNLTLEIQDQAIKGARRASRAQLQVDIVDCNDNSPVFAAIPSVVFVEENRSVRTSVFTVEAHDADHGDNGFLSFSLANLDAIPFAIDHFSGEIFTKEVLDYESMRRTYSLFVRASDWGNPFRRESEIILKVRIKDVNDNKPQFEKVNCTGYLSREAPIGTELVVVSAIDFDSGNIISYRILSGNDDFCFELDSSTGSLKTKCSLRTDRSSFRLIYITATDGMNVADAMFINITLVNSNRNRKLSNMDAFFNCQETTVAEELNQLLKTVDLNNAGTEFDSLGNGPSFFSKNLHTPRFSSSQPNRITIKEDLKMGSIATTILAVDEDHGYNSRIAFVITGGNDDGAFKIDTYSGNLTVVGILDRETRDSYALNITIQDQGLPSKSRSMILTVNLEDVNDNAPVFEKLLYTVTTPEDTTVNTTLLQVIASDKDLGANGRVSYRMQNTEYFSIDARSGKIILTRSLDREHTAVHELVILATDRSADSPMSSSALMRVHVKDVNDNAPKFHPSSYSAQLLEDMPVGMVVTTLFAHDPDFGSNGVVRYSLVDGMDDKFEIDGLTGTIRLVKEVNFDKKQLYNITAMATDNGEPTMSSRCNIVIRIIDVNNNLHPPLFKDVVFMCHVRENQPAKTSVMQVLTTDNDNSNPLASSKDFQVVYSIRDGSGLGLFTIDNRGMIYTKEPLDRETTSFFWLTVYAQDLGSVPLSSMTEIYVEIDDINDNIPLTANPVYYPTIPEHSPEGTSVLQLQAFDLDDEASPDLTYEITGGNPQGFFAIDRQTGLITSTHRMLDREKQDEHILEVTINDNGIPPLTSTTRVVVTVTDINDEVPQFLDRQYRVRVPHLPVSRFDLGLYRVVAHDRDLGSNGDIDYSIVNTKDGKAGSKFTIHSKTGVIFSTMELDVDEQYVLQIQAADNGQPSLMSTTKVILTVVDVPKPGLSKSANQPPEFSTAGLTITQMESDNVGDMVCLMSATDADGDKIWFFIDDGNQDDTFSINTEHGNIILARRLDWETVKFYNLSVMATDGIHQVHTWVYIKVLDVNDNSPLFSQTVYTVEVPENLPIGSRVLSVTATDADEDRRLFYTIYSTVSQTSASKFKINSETGEITTLRELNREADARHELTIMVKDQGTPSKRSLARVVIHVLDHNDHSPEFLPALYEGRIYSTAAIGTSVVQVIAVDADKGANAEIKYSILSGNLGGKFKIDEKLGIIALDKPLEDGDSRFVYSLTVKAEDGGSPSLFSTAKVNIELATSNDASPNFDQHEYSVDIAENQPIGSFVSAVHAICQSTVVYEIVGSQSNSLFSINPFSGIVFSDAIFNYEERSLYNITVRATNTGGLSAEAQMLIHISDLNDNRPSFNRVNYTRSISETAPPGSYVMDQNNEALVVRASDLDSNRNALLLYWIVDPGVQDLFEIVPSTGAIKTKVILDRELVSRYEFTVQVSDHGEPSLSAEIPVQVIITVEDVNDSPPLFSEKVYRTTLLLPTQSDVELLKVAATDADSPENTRLEYSIVGGNALQNFNLNRQTGMLTVLDVEDMLDNYELTISVTDGRFEGRAKVEIGVDFRQTTGLVFTSEVYYSEIFENSTGSQHVSVVQTIGHALEEHLTFSILNPRDLFEISRTSGVIRTVGKVFDRESRDNYVLVVEVSDQRTPPRIAHCLVNVTVLDVNDNAPVFVNQPYFSVVPVDTQQGELVKKVVAIDRDVGENGNVEYSLVEKNGPFDIRKDTGEIIVNGTLALFESNANHKLVIEAKDRGNISLSARAEVFLTIVNKAAPVFEHPLYTVTAKENLPAHSAIATIMATSPIGAKLIYSIVKGDTFNEFSVDFNTDMDILSSCSIATLESLDYETAKIHELVVRATDIKTGSYAETIVRILVEDVNDHAPSFEKLLYGVTVPESVPIGGSILTVLATDDDSGHNSRIRYHIEPHPSCLGDASFFHIDNVRGLIIVKHRLDFEQSTRMCFNVIANDAGNPPLSSTVIVAVNITDTNDNAPKFDQLAYEARISDKAKKGQFVAIVQAFDDDVSDRHKLAYSIIGGDAKQAFVVNSTSGIISVNAFRHPELQLLYILNVSVTDGVFTSFAWVKINVEGSNSHVPAFDRTVYEIEISKNASAGQYVTKVTAVDGDTGVYGQLTYKISDEAFTIDAKTGVISTRVSLDRARDYHFQVSAIDGGGKIGQAGVRVHVGDDKVSESTFIMSDYKANVYASSPVASSVVKVTSSDEDLVIRAQCYYSIVAEGGNITSEQYFAIHSTSGVISTKSSLLGLENQLFQFFVRARNCYNSSTSEDVAVEVYVMGPEDDPPVFGQDAYMYFVSEDRPVGWKIATVGALSNDSLSYMIVPGYASLDAGKQPSFSIDNSGVIRISTELDREETEIVELTIRAETDASPPLVAHARVTIQLQDVNDNVPKFEVNRYPASISENVIVGSKVVQVKAVDPDLGARGEVVYEFTTKDHDIGRFFAIDSHSGVITSVVSFDREEQERYTFDVAAFNREFPERMSTATVVVTVIDQNDSPPVFSHESYSGAVNEDALPGTIILSVSVVDADLEPNDQITLHIMNGDPFGQFGVRKSGEIYVNKELDRESNSEYKLTVYATDGLHVSQCQVALTILDANDNTPVCDQVVYQTSIPENIPVGSFVLRVTATDSDEPGTRNSRIEYFIESNVGEMFAIHKRSGVISTKKLLDRETIPEYHLKVIAQDGGGLSCASDVHILLNDINDNAPRFLQSHYNVTVTENSVSATLVARVTAVDSDLGINRRVSYSMINTDGVFSIDATSGIVTLHKSLDRETQAAYNLMLTATDQGHPPLTSSVNMTVFLVDVNDNPPEFEKTLYKFTVSESSSVGTSIGQVFATSKDTGVNAEISYMLLDDTGVEHFEIDSATGVISVHRSLDFELVREYTLVVLAADGGTPSLSSTALVSIDITDANDNPPMFVQSVYEFTVEENVLVNTSVVQVEAYDTDTGSSGQLEYQLTGGDSLGQFSIHPTSGHLFVTGPLDREKIPRYTLVVSAIDKGHPPLTASVSVNVELTDVNDSPPRFTNDNFTAAIQVDGSGLPVSIQNSDSELGMSVFALEVTDDDLEPNRDPFSFDIIAGNKNEFFIDQNGVIRTATKFNRQVKDSYTLTIRVFDNGTPPLFSDIDVLVVIIEESAFPPVITPLTVRVTAVEDSYPGGVIGKVRATDRDSYDHLIFALLDNHNLFSIDPVKGTLRTTESLDIGEYLLNVSVTDGKFFRYADVRITVDGLLSEMTDYAVVVRFRNLLPEEFIATQMSEFISCLKTELVVREKDVKILSVQLATNTVVAPSRRKIRRTESHLDVLVAVQKSPNKYFRSNVLRRRLESGQEAIEKQMNVKIVKIFNNVCSKDSCMEGECTTLFQFNSDQAFTIMSDSESYVSIPHVITYKCSCKPGVKGPLCGDSGDICTPGLCKEPKICTSNGQTYTCSCPPGRGGDDCREIVELPCNDAACRKDKPLTFSGYSYIRWRLTVPMEKRLSLYLELKTVQQKARILHAVGRFDYSILEIEDGKIQYRFDCGSGPGIARVDKIAINDGYWHSIVVERINKNVRIVVDGVYIGDGSAPGINDVLNLDSNDVFFGAEVEMVAHGYEDIRQGFVGCMQKIKIDLVDLPLAGSSSVGVLQYLQDIDFHCKGTYLPGICSSSPCLNGGSCAPLNADEYVCKCRGRFTGSLCETDTNPCASNPCLNGGHCTNLLNDFRCACQSRLKGKRCELNRFCDPNPCKNGGRCIDGSADARPLCECIRGFQGERCDRDVDECLMSPCGETAVCHNVLGGFYCNCTGNSAGELCDKVYFPNMSSSPWNIRLEEIIGISVSIVLLLCLALVFLLICRCQRRKHRRHRQNRQCKVDDDTYEAECRKRLNNQSCGYSNQEQTENCENIMLTNTFRNNGSLPRTPKPSPCPPPLPKRPVSYTPSTADGSLNTLNNIDMARNYGSAADELENTGICEPIIIPEFLQNVSDVELSPRPMRSLPPPPVDDESVLNNLNKFEHYRKQDFKLSKVMPSVNQSMQSVQLLQAGAVDGSISSLPISDCEDEPKARVKNEDSLGLSESSPTSPTFSRHSSDFNNMDDSRVNVAKFDAEDNMDELEGNESEYVGDSEFAENEDEDDLGELLHSYHHPSLLNFRQVLTARDDLNSESGEGSNPCLTGNDNDSSQESHPTDWADDFPDAGAVNGNFNSADYICRDDDDDVIHYGFPSSPNKNRPTSYTDTETGISCLDDMSVSMSGYRSTNASASDISGLCEIEDSEANTSGDDDVQDQANVRLLLPLITTKQTQV